MSWPGIRAFKTALLGGGIGFLLGVLGGGLSSSLFGQPFSGATGLQVFHLGMFFPGLVIVAPVTAGLGAVIGAVVVWFRESSGSCKRPKP